MNRSLLAACLFAVPLLAAACADVDEPEDVASAMDDELAGKDDRARGAAGTYVGDAILARFEALENDKAYADPKRPGRNLFRDMRGVTWQVTTGNAIVTQLPTPAMDVWETTTNRVGYVDMPLPKTCRPGEPRCDPDFALVQCQDARNADQLCRVESADHREGAAPGARVSHPGRCRLLNATRSVPGAADHTPGGRRALCVGHSDEVLLDKIYDLITTADTLVDIANLQEPNGRYLPTLRNAITSLGHQGKKVTVRLTLGRYDNAVSENPRPLLDYLTSGLPRGSQVTVYVGVVGSGWWWNHAKIVAADGVRALVGGHNMNTFGEYLDTKPAHDVSVVLQGPAARHTHQFINWQWEELCDTDANSRDLATVKNRVWLRTPQGTISKTCPGGPGGGSLEPPATPPAAVAGGARVFGVGRLGDWADGYGNHSDLALLAMIKSARSSIRFSQQDFYTITHPFPAARTDVMEALVRRLAAEPALKVEIVVGSAYYTANTIDNPIHGEWQQAFEAYQRHGYGSDDDNPYKLIANFQATAKKLKVPATALCRLTVAEVRFAREYDWGSRTAGDSFVGEFPGSPGSHSKVVIVDDQAYYVGSHNIYPPYVLALLPWERAKMYENADPRISYRAGLAEYGFIVDDAAATRQFLTGYWNTLWWNSSPTGMKGWDSPACPR